MNNVDKRSLLLSMLLGDGCLAYTSNKTSASLTIDHGIAQSDYIAWKANIASAACERDIKVRTGHKGKSVQFSVCMKRFRAWRKFCYPNGQKSLERILRFIKHPEFAIAVWLMDDGYVEPSISKLATGEKKCYGARFRIFTESQPIQDHDYFIQWFKDNLDITPKIHTYKCKKRNKTLPFLKFTQEDSLKIWEVIRETVLIHKSMQYKFRHIENLFQNKMSQCAPSTNNG